MENLADIITGLQVSNEALRKENEELKDKYQETDTLYWQQVREIAELKAKLDKAKDGLMYYAINHATPNEGAFGSGSTDFGQVAQKTLEGLD